MRRLAGKRALMTGAGGLLGADLCRAFAAEGADLVITTRSAAKLDPLAAQLRGMGARVTAIAADFTRTADIDRLAAEAWQVFGGIDVVLLSSQPPEPNLGSLLTTRDEDWQEQFSAIVWGPLRLMRQLAPRMMEAGGGSVIALTSSTGFDPIEGYAAYGLAKAGLWTLTQYMAREWGKGGIRANALQPGLIVTGNEADHAARQESASRHGVLARTSLGRLGRNHECTGAAIYLASDESSFTSGQRIAVDGGRF
ncbi:MAG: SDR family oxidoreductase [Novosphingobium sp.]|nr:SDR family oxidoreductase [Novosphingobium sp.]